jgi:hypothetical protein
MLTAPKYHCQTAGLSLTRQEERYSCCVSYLERFKYDLIDEAIYSFVSVAIFDEYIAEGDTMYHGIIYTN